MTATAIVRAEWDDEAQVWVATSDDIQGLVTEAENIELLRKKIEEIIPDLLEQSIQEVPFVLIANDSKKNL